MSDLSERAREIFNSWNNPPSPELPKGAGIVLELAERIAELEAALKNLHDEFDLVPALTREAIASEREECALIVERRATVASAAEAEICREISAAIRARAA